MIFQLDVLNHLNNEVNIKLSEPGDLGIAIRSITGLGPEKANVSQQERATMDGSTISDISLPARNIVISVLPQFGQTVEEVRLKCYAIWPIKKMVKLTFTTEFRHAYIYGYVEGVEPNIFSKEEEITISIRCEDPYFRATERNYLKFSGIVPKFTFPFSNESLTEKLLIMGDIKEFTEENVFYPGDEDVGMLINIAIKGVVENITIHNVAERETLTILTQKIFAQTGSGLKDGDALEISTVAGDKYIRLLRNGVYYNVLNSLQRTSNWLQLHPGDNILTYVADTGRENMLITIEYDTVYTGI